MTSAVLLILGIAFAGEGGFVAPKKDPVTGVVSGGSGASSAGKTGATSATPKKGLINTNIYEKTSRETTFTAQVKIVREIQDSWDVVFEGKPGSYTVNVADHQAMLTEAQKAKAPVTVRVDEETNRVISVMMAPVAPQNPKGM